MMLSKIRRDQVKNLAFVASTRLDCSKKQMGVDVNNDFGLFSIGVKRFGVITSRLGVISVSDEPAYHRTFRAWIEDWERPLLVRNDSVAEAKLLAKYKGLRFFLPDDEVIYTIFESNLEFQKGSKKKKIPKGWNVFGVPPNSDNGDDDEPFMIDDLLCQLIADTEQEKGVEVIKNDKMPANENVTDEGVC